MPESNPLHEGLGRRTYSPLLESLSLIIPSKSCCKVHTEDFCFLPLSHSLFLSPSLPLSIYSLPACHPSSDSGSIFLSHPSCLCSTLFISVCFGISVSLSHFLLVLLLTLPCVSPVQSTVDMMSLTSQAQDGSALLVLTACPQMQPGFRGIYVLL